MECRVGCGACCIAPSISSAIPGMPLGKPAGVRCVQLDEHDRCQLFGQANRPKVCLAFTPSPGLCGDTNQFAFQQLQWLEQATA